MFSIGKVALEVGVPESTIRYWQLNFKHIEYETGLGFRKYYDEKAIEEFRKIKILTKTNGLKISAIKKMIKNGKITGTENICDIYKGIKRKNGVNVNSCIHENNENYKNLDKESISNIIADIQNIKSIIKLEMSGR